MSSNDQRTLEVLRDIRRWLKFANIADAKAKVEEAISSEDEEVRRDNLIIYHLSDGEHSSREIAEYVSVSYRTVSTRQGDWADIGLMEKPSENSSYCKLINLEDVGLSAPDIPEEVEDED